MLNAVHRSSFGPLAFTAVALMVCSGAAPTLAPKQDQPVQRVPVAQAAAADSLAVQEQQIAERYKHLEEVLLRMAELTAATDPRRAAMLKKAVTQSKDRLITVQFEQIVTLLDKEQLSRALENQGALDKDLKGLLELLMSENRAKRLESEKARIARYLKLLGELIKEQKGIQGRTLGDSDPARLAGEQGQLADKTGGLSKDIKANADPAKSPAPNDSGPKRAAKEPEKGPKQPQPSDSLKNPDPHQDKKADKQDGSKSPKNQTKPAPKPVPSGKGKPDDKPRSAEGGPEPSPPSQPEDEQSAARKRIDAAQKAMREARQKLEEAKRNDAVKDQEEAIRQLQQAKAALEEILRQLREEEMDRVLAMLEVRFRKMLQMQREVLEGTVRLDKIPEPQRTHEHDIEAGGLSGKEAQIVGETDRALLVLREEGTAVAFPEALSQARQDMQQVVDRLAESKVNKITQNLEEDVIAALEEMIEALKKAQKKLEDRKQRPSMPSGEGMSTPLVDTLSEIKMIRTLQMRVNSRTERYSKLIDGEQAEKADLVEALRRLAERQARIFEITRDLELGKNQ